MNIMRERAAEIGATLVVSSRLKQGTRILCKWPQE
jgi:nitrate/nitrite-specific signal transduction histidine kinase